MANYAEALSAKPPRPGKKVLDHITVHPAENGGHIVEHHFENYAHEPERHVFSASEGAKVIAHIEKHMGIKGSEE